MHSWACARRSKGESYARHPARSCRRPWKVRVQLFVAKFKAKLAQPQGFSGTSSSPLVGPILEILIRVLNPQLSTGTPSCIEVLCNDRQESRFGSPDRNHRRY